MLQSRQQRRRLGRQQTVITDSSARCQPLRLLGSGTANLQQAINQWHDQPAVHALQRSASIVAVQIPRFQVSSGTIEKCQQEWQIQGTVDVPVFEGSDSLAVLWRAYRVTAAIIHEGPLPTSGHYRATLCSERGEESRQWITQDGVTPTPIKGRWPAELRRGSYVIFAALSQGQSSAG